MDRLISLRGSRLAQDTAGMAHKDQEALPHGIHTGPATVGAYPFPASVSFRTSLSTVNSAVAHFNRALSCSSSWNRRAVLNNIV